MDGGTYFIFGYLDPPGYVGREALRNCALAHSLERDLGCVGPDLSSAYSCQALRAFRYLGRTWIFGLLVQVGNYEPTDG